MSEPSYDELLLFMADVFRWDVDALGHERPERLSNDLRVRVGDLIGRVPRALQVKKVEPFRYASNIYDHLKSRLIVEGDLSELQVDAEERAALRELVTTGRVTTYRHRPNDGSSVLLYWQTVVPA